MAERGKLNTIRQVTTAGVVTTFAGGGVAGSKRSRVLPTALAPRPVSITPWASPSIARGEIYVSDSTNNTIRLITPAGVVTTFAGLAGVSGAQDGTGNAALFNNPQGLAVDSSNNIYVADTGNSCIRRINPAGVVVTGQAFRPSQVLEDGFNIYAFFNQPRGLVVDSSANVSCRRHWQAALRQVTPNSGSHHPHSFPSAGSDRRKRHQRRNGWHRRHHEWFRVDHAALDWRRWWWWRWCARYLVLHGFDVARIQPPASSAAVILSPRLRQLLAKPPWVFSG